MRNDFYVYIYYRLDGSPCYVGKGCGHRWKRHPSRRDSNKHLVNIINKAGGSIPRRKIVVGLTEADAFAWERELIAEIGRKAHGGPLVNLTDGGEGTAGAVMTAEWRAHRSKMAKDAWKDPDFSREQSERMRGNNFSVGHVKTPKFTAETSARMTGNKNTLGFRHTDEARAKMSAARKGKPKPFGFGEKISAALTGRVASDETRAKLSAALKGKIQSPETRAKKSAANKGKKKSPEAIENCRAEMIRRWQDPEYKGSRGMKHTIEAKEKVAASKRGKSLSDEHRAAISASRKGQGHPHTEDSKAQIRAKALERAARRLEASE